MSANLRINRIDALEPRFLLASFASLNAAGVLSVVGDSHSNVINVAYSGSNVKVTRDGSSLSFDKSKVKAIWCEAFGGNDKVTIGVALPSKLIGDAGNDTLTGNVKDDMIYGGSGDDRMFPGDGSNIVDHGSGNDVIDYSNLSPGAFSLSEKGLTHPGGGIDVVGNSAATVLLTPGIDTFVVSGESDDFDSNLTIDGGAGNDHFTVSGNPYRTSIARLNGGAGNDTFWWDIESGSVGFVDGGPGNDVVNDNDEVNGPIAADGGSGYDTYNLTFDEAFIGGDKDVTVPTGFEAFTTMNTGNLIVRGNGLNNVITGTAASVTLYGNGGDDKLTLDTSAANYTGGPEDEYGIGLLAGGSGNDTLIGNGATVFKGDSGNDTADFSSRTSNLTISLDNLANDGESGEGANVMADVETILGGSGNDKLTGNPFANNLQGGNGNDTLWGGAGNDTLTGGGGHDKLYGQDGNDTIYAKDSHTDTLDGGNGTDTAQRDHSATIKDLVLNIEAFI